MLTTEVARLTATISGEMRPADVPVADGVDVEAIKAGDPDPMEVVVEIAPGKSKRGWNYRLTALESIVRRVNEQTLSGFLGHQKPDEVLTQFPTPVTHWVGAKLENGKAYFRGVIDQVAKDLKRWIRSGRVKQVSIFGVPKLRRTAGETEVVDYEALSIDWTPLGRAGMETRVVAVGEIFEGGDTMDWKQLVQQLKGMLQTGDVTLTQVAGEMGWTPEQVAGAIDGQWVERKNAAEKKLQAVTEALGVTGEMDAAQVAREAKAALDREKERGRQEIIDGVIREKVGDEKDQKLIAKMLKPAPGATREQIAGEIDTLLADESVQEILSRRYTDKPPVVPGAKADKEKASSNLKIKRNAI